jgi:hypothetical protein
METKIFALLLATALVATNSPAVFAQDPPSTT